MIMFSCPSDVKGVTLCVTLCRNVLIFDRFIFTTRYNWRVRWS